ncbi:5' nucleotidase, NT5C type [Paenibacillus methanolicus]|uniref:5'(3')-deoxyribonucleotidase n=1 Tax=Paenibacillus methanolicus TaxID=582686 RepID=A0A5S5C2F4_9BACL|nr:5'-3'-deoxyribonucleotidase [Paenibacillus methanolicus]TYP73339.1 5'(3')-deoxyribonucleotidase [Paenibacillus methanolicus]
MKRIAIDMDEVIADFNTKHLSVFNRDYKENLTVRDLMGTRLRELRPQWKQEILAYLNDPLFFRDLDVMKDSQTVIKELSERYEIFITTAAMEFPSSFAAKYEWLKEHFPFIPEMNFVFCGDKSIIRADYLIDDNARHFQRFNGQGILFSAPHNLNETGYVRVENWLEVRAYFQRSCINSP